MGVAYPLVKTLEVTAPYWTPAVAKVLTALGLTGATAYLMSGDTKGINRELTPEEIEYWNKYIEQLRLLKELDKLNFIEYVTSIPALENAPRLKYVVTMPSDATSVLLPRLVDLAESTPDTTSEDTTNEETTTTTSRPEEPNDSNKTKKPKLIQRIAKYPGKKIELLGKAMQEAPSKLKKPVSKLIIGETVGAGVVDAVANYKDTVPGYQPLAIWFTVPGGIVKGVDILSDIVAESTNKEASSKNNSEQTTSNQSTSTSAVSPKEQADSARLSRINRLKGNQ